MTPSFNRYQYLWKWLHGYKRILFLVLISSLLVTFLGMNWPLVYRHLINQVFYQRDFKKLERVLLVYAALFVAEKILQLIWRLADGVMASNFVYSVKNTLYEKIFSLNMASKENYSTGELLDIMNQDVQQIYTFLMDEGVFAITCAKQDGEVLVYHTYIVGDTFVRSYQSASQFRREGVSARIVGIANRYLHKSDMMYFKEMGKTVYDWGGAGLREEVKSITEFKESFGGDELYYYDCEDAVGLKAEAVKGIINLIGVLTDD